MTKMPRFLKGKRFNPQLITNRPTGLAMILLTLHRIDEDEQRKERQMAKGKSKAGNVVQMQPKGGAKLSAKAPPPNAPRRSKPSKRV